LVAWTQQGTVTYSLHHGATLEPRDKERRKGKGGGGKKKGEKGEVGVT